MPEFVATIAISSLARGQSTTVSVHGREIAVFNVDGKIFAIDDSCPHAGSSLGFGRLDGQVVTCRAHGLRFDVTTGNNVASPSWGVESFPVKIENGKICIAAHSSHIDCT